MGDFGYLRIGTAPGSIVQIGQHSFRPRLILDVHDGPARTVTQGMLQRSREWSAPLQSCGNAAQDCASREPGPARPACGAGARVTPATPEGHVDRHSVPPTVDLSW